MSLLRREDPHSLAAPYALDALGGDERRRFEKHLASCGACAAEVRALAEDAVRLAWSTAAVPPHGMRERVFAAVQMTPQEPAGARGPDEARGRREEARGRRDDVRERTTQLPPHVWGAQPPPARSRAARAPRARRPLFAFFAPFATVTAAAALVVAALFAVQARETQGKLDTAQAQAERIAHVLAAPDARAGNGKDAEGHGIGVIASVAEGEAVVTLSGYGELTGGRVHQLWLMRPAEQPRSLGLFSADTPLVATGLETDATSLAVTVEPDGGSPQPTSQPVVQLALKSVGFGE